MPRKKVAKLKSKNSREVTKQPKEKQIRKVLSVINVSLIILSFLLVLNLFGISLPNLGFALYDTFDTKETVCLANWQDDYSEINIDYCCHESIKQLECVAEDFEIELNLGDGTQELFSTSIVCKTGDNNNNMKYYLNDKAYRYCKNQNYWG